uniref:Phospholipase A2 n=1 Tax=Pelusios castaneus TaxID=367368 RepID=A0A8C8SY80_9SAUR
MLSSCAFNRVSLKYSQLSWTPFPFRSASHGTLPISSLREPKSAFLKSRVCVLLLSFLPLIRILNSTISWSLLPRLCKAPSWFLQHFQSDCYVTLWLPTASTEKIKTKAINNCKDPVWNETFYYRIQSQVKVRPWELTPLFFGAFLPGICPTARMQVMFLAGRKIYIHKDVKMTHLNSEVCHLVPHCRCVYTCKLTCVFPGLCSSSEDLDVRLGFDLCTEEHDFLCKRKKYVAAALKKVLQLEEDLQDDEIPVVAIMTTGGGMRSLTTTYGSLLGLKKLNVIDCAMYLTGLSGTTWAMANLYRDSDWSWKDLEGKIDEARKHVTKCKMGSFSTERMKYYSKELCQRKQEGHRTSAIDLWGLIVEYLLHDGKDIHKLSDQQQAVDQGQNPLPIYVAINVKDNYSTLDFKDWMEFTPYEVGFMKYGAFIRSEDFGSEFFMGRLMRRLPESRICYLEGMWSSLFSFNLLYIWNLKNPLLASFAEEESVLPMRPCEQKTQLFTPAGPFSSVLRGALTDRISVAQYHSFLKGLQLHKDYLENDNFCRWKDTVLDTSPNQLTETGEYLSLVDTGFFINTSCPPLLRPERKVDVILHLNYSAGSQILVRSCKYYAEQGIPFPKVVLSEEERKNLKECYLFEDAETPGAPILLFFPLLNDTYQSYKAPGKLSTIAKHLE